MSDKVSVIKKRIKKLLGDVKVEKVPLSSGEELKDKIALITGGGSGIGYGIASEFRAHGARVIITGRNEAKLADSCHKLGGIDYAQYIVWDHSRAEIIDEKFEIAKNIFGRIDILVNNAGYHGNQKFLTISVDDYDQTFDVNVKNLFFMCQKFSQYQIDNSLKGNILNISSASSVKPAWSPYEISKWACRGFTKGLARELAPYGITVNGIAPGPTATDMSNYIEGDPVTWNAIPKGRMAIPEEIGNLAVFLCSDMGHCIIGETVFCDGGSGTLTMNK